MDHSLRLTAGAVLLFAFVTLPTFTLAQSIEGDVELPDNCVVQDKNGIEHSFPKDDSPSAYLAVCALAKALETGLLADMQLGEFPDFGLFVEGLDSTVAGGDEYWALWLNGNFAECGIECLPLSEGDAVSFILTSFEGEERGASVTLHITALLQSSGGSTPSPSSSSSGGGGEYLQDRPFNVSTALNFLADNQNDDGSFSSALLTDWAAIAFGGAEGAGCGDWCQVAYKKLRTYLLSAKPELSSITDYERHVMALMALDIDPYAETGSDYITPIVDVFDGTQVGEASLVNDDIFALFPLLHAGYKKTDAMIENIVTFILSKQKLNGSWEGSVDLTAAAIQALSLFPVRSDVAEAIKKAEEFLRRNQNESGIFGSNSFSLSWVLQAIRSLGQTPDDWKKSGVTPLGYLGVLQQEDGGVEPTIESANTRVWATSYAIPAALGKPWGAILHDFTRSTTTELIATSTDIVATAMLQTRAPQILVSANAPAKSGAFALASESIATTTNTISKQFAAAATPINSPNNEIWLWFSGLIVILCVAYVFLRRD